MSCKPVEKIWLYKDTNLVDRPISTTIDNFVWNNYIIGERDSVSIKNKEKLILIIESINKNKEKKLGTVMNFSPQYAFLVEYKSIKDTLYFDYNLTYGNLLKINFY